MNGRPISEAPEQSLYGQLQVSFRPNDFNSVIWAHGYDIICEKAIRCPCQGTRAVRYLIVRTVTALDTSS